MKTIKESILVPVTGSTGNVYSVDVSNGTCTCPHYVHRLKGGGGMCKHMHTAYRAFKKEKKEKKEKDTPPIKKENLVPITGTTGNVYNVDVCNKTCSCPHYTFRLQGTDGICKHITQALDIHTQTAKQTVQNIIQTATSTVADKGVAQRQNERLFELLARAHNHTQGEPIDYDLEPTVCDHLKAIHKMQENKVPDEFQEAYLKYFKFK